MISSVTSERDPECNSFSLPFYKLSKEELIRKVVVMENRVLESERRLRQAEYHLHKLRTFVFNTLLDESIDLKTIEFNKSQQNSSSDEADYFATYSNFHIHEEMLKDKVRTESYQNFIYQNADFFKGKIVMDIGCGTGILSMFAVKAGAQHVVAVDKADIIHKAKFFAEENKMSDKITFIHSKVEEIEELVYVGGDGKIDIIISEWMGYCLLFESMLPSIIESRDKFLRPGGKVFPNRVSLHIAAIEDRNYRKEKIDFWNDVYGFNMSHMIETILMEVVVAQINPEQIVSDIFCFKEFDINTVTLNDINFTSTFELKMENDDRIVDGFVVWFDTHFTDPCLRHCLSFSTGPFALPTHWRQASFYLKEALPIRKNQLMKGKITMKKGRIFARDLDIVIEYQLEQQEKKKQFFHLE
jgi:protein arginine N-methyltransferase 1